ncbi:MAG: hypothetical protein WAW87_06545 [Candidatus Ferrigenium altingense]
MIVDSEKMPSMLYEKLKRFAATNQGMFMMIYGPALLGLPLALFLPDDVLSSNMGLLSLTNYIGQQIPMITKLANSTDFPQVARLYYSFMFLLMPLWFCGLFLLPAERLVPLEHHIKHKIREPLIYFLGVTTFVYVEFMPHAEHKVGGIMSLAEHSRVGLGIWGGLLVCGMVCLTFFILLWVRRIPKIYKLHN